MRPTWVLLILGTSAHDLRLPETSATYGCKRSQEDAPHTPAPGSAPSYRTLVHVTLPTCHPHGMALVVPKWRPPGAMNLIGFCGPPPFSLGRGPLWLPGTMAGLQGTQSAATASAPPRPSLGLGLGPASTPSEDPSTHGLGGSWVCDSIALCSVRRSPQQRSLSPNTMQRLTKLLCEFQTTRRLSAWSAEHTPPGMVELGWRGLRFQPLPRTWYTPLRLALWLAPEFMFSKGQRSLGCPAAPPCPPASIGCPQLPGKETPALPGEFPVSKMRKLKVSRAVPGPRLCDRLE